MLSRLLSNSRRIVVRVAAFAGAMAWSVVGVSIGARGASAQAFNYPSLQLPTVSTRDYTAAIAGGEGSTLLFQWRENTGERGHFGVDAGIADSRARDPMVFLGASIGREVMRATEQQPLDLLATGGVNVAFGAGTTLIRVPLGVSVGHTFELERDLALTPYVHPRLSLDRCADCGKAGGSRSEVSLNFDLGANLQVSREFAVRVAGVFSGSDLLGGGDAFAVGLNWTPAALRRPVPAK